MEKIIYVSKGGQSWASKMVGNRTYDVLFAVDEGVPEEDVRLQAYLGVLEQVDLQSLDASCISDDINSQRRWSQSVSKGLWKTSLDDAQWVYTLMYENAEHMPDLEIVKLEVSGMDETQLQELLSKADGFDDIKGVMLDKFEREFD